MGNRGELISLWDWQEEIVVNTVTSGHCLLVGDTGIGKTIIQGFSASVSLDHGYAMIITPNQNVLQTIKTLEKCGLEFYAIREIGDISGLHEEGNIRDKIIILPNHMIGEPELAVWLVLKAEHLMFLALDEAHHFSNDSSWKILSKLIAEKFHRCVAYTATPITRSIRQILVILAVTGAIDEDDIDKILRPHEIRDITGRVVGYRNLDLLAEKLNGFIFHKTREELGIKGERIPHVLKCSPSPSQLNRIKAGEDYNMILKREYNESHDKVISLCSYRYLLGKQSLIYAWNEDTRQILLDQFQKQAPSLVVREISGRISSEDCSQVSDDFMNKEVDVVVTSITESINLSCDGIILFSVPPNYKQLIGRTERGSEKREVSIYLVYFPGTPEEDYFRDVVSERVLSHETFFKSNEGDVHQFLSLMERRS